MNVQYIFHSGFLVETGKCCYIFDYYRGEVPKLDPDKPIVVLCSHGHQDHYNPEIFAILQARGIKDVFVVLARDIPEKKYPDHVSVLKAYAGQTYELSRGEQLQTLRSTDSGVAFVLTTDEGVVYHAGDLNDWAWDGESDDYNKQMRGNYRHEIDKLKGKQIDVAFVPLDPRQEAHYADGLRYFLETVHVKSVYPMHYWEKPDVIDRFIQEYPQYKGIVQCLK